MRTDTNRLRGRAAVLLICFCLTALSYGFAGGTGTADDPYQIATAEQLISIGSDPNLLDKHFILLNDIDLDPNLPGGRVFTKAVIAPDISGSWAWEFIGIAFTGCLEGTGHVISNLVIDDGGSGHVALFGLVGPGSCVRNLGVENVMILGMDCAGGLAGRNQGLVVNCHTSGYVSAYRDVGGLIGWNEGTVSDCHAATTVMGSVQAIECGGLVGGNQGHIMRCHATGDVSARVDLGGLVGCNAGGTIIDCYATGRVSGEIVLGGLVGNNYSWSSNGISESSGGVICGCYACGTVAAQDNSTYVGGLVGDNWYHGRITSCYADAEVSAGDKCQLVGGLVGCNDATIANSYSISRVLVPPGTSGTGALVGDGYVDVVTNSFWDTQRCGIAVSHRGLGLGTIDMVDVRTYSRSGWAADANWLMEDGKDYPRLAWEDKPGQRIPEPVIDGFEGTGTPDDPYIITTADQVMRIAETGVLWNKHFALVCDLDFAGAVVPPIGLHPGTEFTGVFDGRGHVLRNLAVRVDEPTLSCIGLFGCVGPGGCVCELGLEQVTLSAPSSSCVGSLAGMLFEGKVTSCYIVGRIEAGDNSHSVGGLVGSNRDGRISSAYADCVISGGQGSDSFGGLVGTNEGWIDDCYASGTLSAGDVSKRIGGLTGRNGTVTSWYDSPMTEYGYVVNCYSVSHISTGDDCSKVGGLVGRREAGSTTNSFWDIESSGVVSSEGGTGLPAVRMKESQTYAGVGWDLAGEFANGTADRWVFPRAGGYPALAAFSNEYQPHMLAGCGTVDDPYQISSVEDLLAMCHYGRSAHFALRNDIDMSGVTWAKAPVEEFYGRFDGTGFTVSGLRIHGVDYLVDRDTTGANATGTGPGTGNADAAPERILKGTNYLGLFGTIGKYAAVKNLNLSDANVVGSSKSENVGLLAGKNEGTILGCRVTGSVFAETSTDSVRGTTRYYGGLIGSSGGSLSDCRADATVTGDHMVGGLVGDNDGCIERSSAGGSITARTTSDYLGGLVGFNSGHVSGCSATAGVRCGREYHYCGGFAGKNAGRICACYATGDVLGGDSSWYVGGFVGWNEGPIARCYSTGRVSSGERAIRPGGFVAAMNRGWPGLKPIEDCFWDVDTSGAQISDGGIALTTARMREPDIFIAFGWAADPNWVFADDYPRLAWEGTSGRRIAEPSYAWLAGAGTEEDPYLITMPSQLALLGTTGALWGKCFALANDLDVTGIEMVPIGLCYGTDFSGTFDGRGHTIRHLTMDADGRLSCPVGLFGCISRSGVVRNVRLEDAHIEGGWDSQAVGSLAGINYGILRDCQTGAEVEGFRKVGGLAGWNEGTISYCTAGGAATGFTEVGGLVGYCNYGTTTRSSADNAVTGGDYSSALGGLVGTTGTASAVSLCSATGNISGGAIARELGGLIGHDEGAVCLCFATGRVSAGDQCKDLGGLVGYFSFTAYWAAWIHSCYAVGEVCGEAGSYRLGGLVGWGNAGNSVIGCYAAGAVSGGIDSGRVGGLMASSEGKPVDCYFLAPADGGGPDNGFGVALSDAQMRQQTSFLGWDFEDIWTICEGKDYPRLRWEGAQCEEQVP